jgi:hypothetical protein
VQITLYDIIDTGAERLRASQRPRQDTDSKAGLVQHPAYGRTDKAGGSGNGDKLALSLLHWRHSNVSRRNFPDGIF